MAESRGRIVNQIKIVREQKEEQPMRPIAIVVETESGNPVPLREVNAANAAMRAGTAAQVARPDKDLSPTAKALYGELVNTFEDWLSEHSDIANPDIAYAGMAIQSYVVGRAMGAIKADV